MTEMTEERIKSLRRITNNFDHCCWSRDDHRDVLEALEKLKRLCPACRGEGHFADSSEGGIEVVCDCAANIRIALYERNQR